MNKAAGISALNRSSTPRTALLAPYQALNWLYRPLIGRMKERWGTRFIVLLPEGSDLARKYRPLIGEDGVIEYVPLFERLMSNMPSAVAEKVFERARDNEERYGINYIRDIFQQERAIARGLVAGAPRGAFGDGVPAMPGLSHAANEYFEFYESLFGRHAIDLAMVWPRSGGEAVCAIVAETRGIPVTYPYTAKHKHYAYWSSGATCGNLQHKIAYQEAGECDPIPEAQVAPPARPTYLDQRQVSYRYSFRNVVRQTIWNCIDRVRMLVDDVRAGRFGTARRIPLVAVIKKIWIESNFFKQFVRMCERDLGRLTSEPFVLFAFQNEPEFSVQMRCKEFNDQGAIIRQMALSMPAGVRLVIKEHTWLGGHHLDFYRDLVSLPNVVMAHPEIRAIDLIPKSLAVASLASTVTLEAALFGKPAIIFSERSEFSFLPSVHTVRDLSELPNVVRAAAKADPERALAIRREAARLVKATEAIGFEAKPYFTGEGGELPPEHVDRAMELLQSLIALHHRERARGRTSLDAELV